MLPARYAVRPLSSGLLKLDITPGGGGNAADVGEEAIVEDAQNRVVDVLARIVRLGTCIVKSNFDGHISIHIAQVTLVCHTAPVAEETNMLIHVL